MKFETPAGENPIDRMRVVGKPADRIDGPLKTTGTAPYAYERRDVAPDAAYGYMVGSAVAKGTINRIDTSEAKAAPGVLTIVTTLDVPTPIKGGQNTATLFGGAKVQHYHQAVAIVVAETFEQARAAAIWCGSTTRGQRAGSISPRKRRTPRSKVAAAARAPVPRRSMKSVTSKPPSQRPPSSSTSVTRRLTRRTR